MKPTRSLVVGALALLTSLLPNVPALASAPRFPGRGTLVRVYGQVMAVNHDQANPSTTLQFALQVPSGRIFLLQVNPRTVFVPRTADAAVSGFSTGDYALVRGRAFNNVDTALAVQYDVGPFHPPTVVVLNGTILRVQANGLVVRQRNGRIRRVGTNDQTAYEVNAQPVEVPPLLQRGDVVQIYAEVHGRRLVAVAVMVKRPGT